MENYFIPLLIFVIGTCFGSFLSVIVSRTLSNKSGIIGGYSHCPHCLHRLAPSDLIPILSWLMKKGRCAYCHQQISPHYLALELSSGLLFLTNYTALFTLNQYFDFSENSHNSFFFILKLIFLCSLSLSLLSICFSDLKSKTIPNSFLIFWILICLPAFSLNSLSLSASLINRVIALAIVLIFFGGQYLLSQGRWLGSGDIFIALGMALLLGWEKSVLAIVLSYFIGGIIGIILIISGKSKAKQSIAFGPFLTLGIIISLYFGNQIISWYLSTLII